MKDTKAFLRQVKHIDLEVKSLQQQLEVLDAEVQGGAINYKERVQTSNCNGQEDCIIKLIEAKEEIQKLINKRLETRMLVNAKIAEIGDCTLAYILRERYCMDKQWIEIEKDLRISESKLFKLHRKALKELRRVLFYSN